MNSQLAMRLREILRLAIPALLALIALNISLAHQNIWPTLWVRTTPEFSLELIFIVTGIALATALGHKISSRVQWALSILLLLFVLARYVDVTAPALFGRRIDLYWDTQHVPAIAGMVLESWSMFSLALLGFAILSLFTALLLIIRLALGTICRAIDHPIYRRIAFSAGVLLLALYGAGMNSDALTWERRFAIPITPVYFEQAREITARVSGLSAEAQIFPTPLRQYAELNGLDIFVIFLESYGRIALDNPAYSRSTREKLAQLDATLNEQDWDTRSAYLTAPTFGGASWLSHSSLLAGRTIDNHDLYQAFLHSRNEILTDRFRKAGYRSVLLTPGIRGHWPAGLALRFDRIVAAKDIAYEGQGFGWWHIPDQYSLDWLASSEINTPERHPLFVMFPTIMSHFPFGPVPPYLEDWNALSTPTPFDEENVARSIALGDAFSGDLKDIYRRAILYNLETVSGFISERAPESAIIIAIGDHQPPAAISGEDAPWDIPIHVFARDALLLAPFERTGFVDGMIPQGQSIGRIDELNALILEALEKTSSTSIVAGGD
jgi:hypothetical protein